MLFNITGIDGCGKTTQVKLLQDYLLKEGKNVVISKAYGDEEKKIFSSVMPQLDQLAIMFLFQALHVQQLSKVVIAENRGDLVISDRWDDSYLSYHSKFGILSKNKKLRNELNFLAFKNKKPNLTFLLDIDVSIGQKRLDVRGRSFLDKKSIKFFETMRKSFLEFAKQENWIILDGTNSVDFVFLKIKERVDDYMKFF